jgi:hypothetical protein
VVEMNPRVGAPYVAATALIPGDRILHPKDGRTTEVTGVFRSLAGVTLTLRGRDTLLLPSGYRLLVYG